MKKKTPMKVLTAQLGLKLSNQTSRTTPALAKLLDGLTGINIRYSDHRGIRVIRASEDIKKEVEELFDRIGSIVWPDLDDKTEFPTWLVNPFDKVNEHYRRHLCYSNHTDRAILAELFYEFVCGRLYNSVNNAENRSRIGKRPSSKHFSSSEEPSTPGDDDVFADDNGDDNGDDNRDDLPSPRAASLESQSNRPMSAGHRRMPPNIAPVAPMFSHQSSMDNDQTELGAIDSEHASSRSMQHTKQHKRTKRIRLDQHDARPTQPYTYIPKTGLGGLPFHPPPGAQPRVYDPSEQPQSYRTQHIKRPFFDGTSETSTKRSKISSIVHTPKPSLIVTFKLTQAKDASDRRRTAPPQQPHISTPSSELLDLDEIIAGRSMAPVDRQSDVANFESWTQIGDHQPIVGQQASVESVAESTTDTTPVPSGPETTQTVPDVPNLANATTRASSATQPQPEVTAQDSDSQAIADFHEKWSDQAQPLFDQLLLDFLRQMPVEEVVDRLRSDLVKVRDQIPPNSARSGLLVISSNIGSSTPSMAGVSENTAKGGEQMEQTQDISPTATRSSGEASMHVADTSGPGVARNEIDQVQTTHATDLAELSAFRFMGDAFQCSDAELDRLVRHIDMTVRITREDGSVMTKPEFPDTIGIERIRSGGDFFEALRKEYEHLLQPDDDLFEATVTEVDDPATERRTHPLSLRKGSRERNWKRMLTELQRVHKRDGKDIHMKLVADVAMRKSGANVG